MAIMQRCCCCMNLRSGSIACGIFTLITGLYYILTYILQLLGVRVPGVGIQITLAGVNYAGIVINVVLIIVSILLLIGVSKSNRFLLLPWIISIILIIIWGIINIILFIVAYITAKNRHDSNRQANKLYKDHDDNTEAIIFHTTVWVGIVIMILSLAFMVYCLLCVISLYQELKAGRGRAQDYYGPRGQPVIITHTVQQPGGKQPATYTAVSDYPPAYHK